MFLCDLWWHQPLQLLWRPPAACVIPAHPGDLFCCPRPPTTLKPHTHRCSARTTKGRPSSPAPTTSSSWSATEAASCPAARACPAATAARGGATQTTRTTPPSSAWSPVTSCVLRETTRAPSCATWTAGSAVSLWRGWCCLVDMRPLCRATCECRSCSNHCRLSMVADAGPVSLLALASVHGGFILEAQLEPQTKHALQAQGPCMEPQQRERR